MTSCASLWDCSFEYDQSSARKRLSCRAKNQDIDPTPPPPKAVVDEDPYADS